MLHAAQVMDGHFVPNISWGMPVIKSMRKHSTAFFDVHMMVSEPEKWVEPMKESGADQFTFHLEATSDPAALIQMIKAAGMKVGMAIKPGTSVEDCLPYADTVDLILVMTVEPGFGGQSFMENMMSKVKALRDKFAEKDIQVDGGLSPKTIDHAAKAGANSIVAGSAVFKPEPGAAVAIAMLRRSCEKYGNGKEDSELTPLPGSDDTIFKKPKI